jgi:hypothetical protein
MCGMKLFSSRALIPFMMKIKMFPELAVHWICVSIKYILNIQHNSVFKKRQLAKNFHIRIVTLRHSRHLTNEEGGIIVHVIKKGL